MSSAQLKNSFSSIGEIDHSLVPATLTLKLSVSKNALKYFVVSQTHNSIIFFGSYTLHHIADKETLLVRIEKIFEKDEVLQLSFGEIVIGIDTSYSILPPEFTYLKPERSLLQQAGSASINIVFENDEELISKLTSLFPKAKFAHINATFLNLLPLYQNAESPKMFVNVAPEHLDIILFRADNSLLMMNRYTYKTETDFIYFVLLCCYELKIDRTTTELILIGEVNGKSKIYNICYRYFKNISFITAPTGVHFPNGFNEFPQHLHFNLYNLTA